MTTRKNTWRCLLLLVVGAWALSAAPEARAQDGGNGGGVTEARASEALGWLDRFAQETEGLEARELLERRAEPYEAGVTYEVLGAAHMDLIQGSELALGEGELEALARHGFMISGTRTFTTFTQGYEAIYKNDLPVYVSADSIMYALHRSYDRVLIDVERGMLIPELRATLDEMRAGLREGRLEGLDPAVARDVDAYLAVALSLLSGGPAATFAGGSEERVRALVDAARGATGTQELELFGDTRELDLSQFKPRGHYADYEDLGRYFQAMMWLGRVDLRPVEVRPDGSRVFMRRQFEAAVALDALLVDGTRGRWQAIDETLEVFVGPSDSMGPTDMAALRRELGIGQDLGAVAELDEARVAEAIVNGGYGAQRIASHIVCTDGTSVGPLPRPSSFLLLGQRYTVDSHVFSNVVHDRVAAARMMPDPLDVAYAALGDDAAAALVSGQLGRYGYAPQLEMMRRYVDGHDEGYWSSSLYTLWLGALRALAAARPDDAGLPQVARTEAWGRRLLNTQLASWAELRHDTILYVKQSYTVSVACEFPDAYVDPYPEFFAAVEAYARLGADRLASLSFSDPAIKQRIAAHFEALATVAGTLGEMATIERAGGAFTDAHLAFINTMVKEERYFGCGGVDIAETPGWYRKIFYEGVDPTEHDPTIADVHTQPTDELGAPVGRVLHVATGEPRAMVVTVDTCDGPRAYVGLASAYHEVMTSDYERLNDTQWSGQAHGAPDVAWMSDLVAR